MPSVTGSHSKSTKGTKMTKTEIKLIAKLLSTEIDIAGSSYGEFYKMGEEDAERLILNVLLEYADNENH